jgi:hypothetical protein
MNNDFYEACLVAEEMWFDSMNLNGEEHNFSKAFERKMNKLIDKMRNDKYHRLTRRTTRALIIVAIIVAIATTVFATPKTREYTINKFSNHSEYSVEDGSVEKVEFITIDYVPEGFDMTDESTNDSNDYILREYKKGNQFFTVNKSVNLGYVFYDTEDVVSETIVADDIEYVYTDDLNDGKFICWNYNNFKYCVSGNIEKDELIKIAKNIK